MVGLGRYSVMAEVASHHAPRPGSNALRRLIFERHGQPVLYDADLSMTPAGKPEMRAEGPRSERLLDQPARLICLVVVLLSGVYFLIHGAMFYAGLDFTSRDLGDSDPTDFFVFYSSARFLWDGGAAWELYDNALLKSFQVSLGAGQEGLHPFNYPPIYLFLIWPLGGLSYSVALTLWQVLTLALFAFSLRMAGLRPIEVLAAIVAPVTILNFSGGQNGCLTSALLIGGLALLVCRPIAAGGLFGLLAFKPHLGLLLPVVCLAERRWRTIGAAAGVAIALTGGSMLVFGLASWETYLGYLDGFQAQAWGAQTGSDFVNYSATVLMAGQIMGLSKALAYGAQITISLGVILAVYHTYRRPLDETLRLALLLIGVSLATPYGFHYDLPFTAVAVILMVRVGLRCGFLPFETVSLAAVWLVPFFADLAAARGIPLVSWINLIFFGFVLVRLHRAHRHDHA